MSNFAKDSKEESMPSVLDIEEMLVARLGEISGCDNKSGSYESLTELWEYIYNPGNKANKKKDQKRKKAKASEGDSPASNEKEGNWYQKAANYWENEANCPLNDGK